MQYQLRPGEKVLLWPWQGLRIDFVRSGRVCGVGGGPMTKHLRKLAISQLGQLGLLATVLMAFLGTVPPASAQSAEQIERWRVQGEAQEEAWLAHKKALAAAEKLAEAKEAEAAKVCNQHAKSAGVPAKFETGMYLMEWNYPLFFRQFPCVAAENGVKFNFKSGGLFSKDSFEIRGKSTLRVWVESQAMPTDGTTQLLVPTKFELNGSTFEVSRGNIQLLARHIRTLLANE